MKIFIFYIISLCSFMRECRSQIKRGPGRIIGGEDVDLKEAPFIVSLQIKTHFCAGSLVTLRHVVTAAHCFKGLKEEIAKRFMIVLHDVLSTHYKGTSVRQTRQVSRVMVHHAYNGGDHDIALLKLNRAFDGNNVTDTIEMAKEKFEDGQKCVVFGWGRFSNFVNDTAISLQMAVLTIDRILVCPTIKVKSELCAGSLGAGPDACLGDSGGPLICNGKLAGIVSRGVQPCAQKLIGTIFTKVSHYRHWIKKQIKKSAHKRKHRKNAS